MFCIDVCKLSAFSHAVSLSQKLRVVYKDMQIIAIATEALLLLI